MEDSQTEAYRHHSASCFSLLFLASYLHTLKQNDKCCSTYHFSLQSIPRTTYPSNQSRPQNVPHGQRRLQESELHPLTGSCSSKWEIASKCNSYTIVSKEAACWHWSYMLEIILLLQQNKTMGLWQGKWNNQKIRKQDLISLEIFVLACLMLTCGFLLPCEEEMDLWLSEQSCTLPHNSHYQPVSNRFIVCVFWVGGRAWGLVFFLLLFFSFFFWKKEREKKKKRERRKGEREIWEEGGSKGGNATQPQKFTALIGSKFRRKYMAYAIFIMMQKLVF